MCYLFVILFVTPCVCGVSGLFYRFFLCKIDLTRGYWNKAQAVLNEWPSLATATSFSERKFELQTCYSILHRIDWWRNILSPLFWRELTQKRWIKRRRSMLSKLTNCPDSLLDYRTITTQTVFNDNIGVKLKLKQKELENDITITRFFYNWKSYK